MENHPLADEQQEGDSAFVFEGTWQEFAPIAFTNLLLTIVTLGIYRFWATTRERQYLWSRSRFIDERLEWSGTGLELFIGFMLAAVLILLPFFVLAQVAQALALQGMEVIAGLITFGSFVLVFYLTGVARFRALRYRLSRTRWRGIRGGSDNQGLGYGVSYMWKTFVGYLVIGLLIPWSMAKLWNERWGKMSFGPREFDANLDHSTFFGRFFLFYLSPFIFAIGGVVAAAVMGGAGFLAGGDTGAAVGSFIAVLLMVFGFYFLLGLIAVAFYAQYYREAVKSLSWGDVDFEFNASTKDWLVLFIVDTLLVVFTLGIGLIFIGYRHWKFFIVHMEARGEILLDELTQSETTTAKHGEGLLDAFDIGAI